MTGFAGLVFALALLALVWAAARARAICVLSVRGGRVLVMQGALPPSLHEALADVVARAGVARATLRIVRAGDRGRIEARGLDEPTLQRARNVLGTYSMPRLLAGHRPVTPNLGQRLGVAWLAWRIHERASTARRD